MSEVVSSMEDFWPLRGDVNQVSEEAVQRVQTQAKQAKQVAQQIKKDKAINHHLAQFLAFLIKEIKNEKSDFYFNFSFEVCSVCFLQCLQYFVWASFGVVALLILVK